MKILVSGASGFIGSHLVHGLTAAGHMVSSLVRDRGNQDGDKNVHWDPDRELIEKEKLEDYDAVIHLAGEPVAQRWTSEAKRRIVDSRVRGTRLIAESLAQLTNPPKVFVTASAIGYYGDRGNEVLTEDSSIGTGFLAEVCRDWEAATAPAKDAGIRTAHLRIGIVLSPDGGVLGRLLTPFMIGAGGNLGSGKQYMSWIAMDDLLSMITFALESNVSGPLNAVAPNPVTNEEFTKTLGKVISRPTMFPMPVPVTHFIFGKAMADELLLASNRVMPKRAQDAGFNFQYPTLEPALKHVLGK